MQKQKNVAGNTFLCLGLIFGVLQYYDGIDFQKSQPELIAGLIVTVFFLALGCVLTIKAKRAEDVHAKVQMTAESIALAESRRGRVRRRRSQSDSTESTNSISSDPK
jgi:hypothetical protein